MRVQLGYAAGVLLLAAAYGIAGRLGLWLAIPPGYATAVWPASGIALAALLLGGVRLWPGVWLGSFVTNLWTAIDLSGTGAVLASAVVPSLVSTGAALQAVVGAALVRRFVGYRNILAQEIGSAYLLLLGGPVACLINASVGVTTLWSLGLLPASNVAFNWWTWWIGDTVGVVIFAPLVLIWCQRMGVEWLRRKLLATVPLVAMFFAVVAVFFQASERELARIHGEFDSWTAGYAQELRRNADLFVDAVNQTESFFTSSTHVSREEFGGFTSRLVETVPGPIAVAWAPRVTDAGRGAYESAVRAEGYPVFALTEIGEGGVLRPAARRDEYVVVDYMEPFGATRAVHGLDILSETHRREAIRRSLESHRPQATSAIQLAHEPGMPKNFLIVKPVFERGGDLRGFVVAAFRFSDLVESALWVVPTDALQVRLIDVEGTQPQPVYATANVVDEPGRGTRQWTRDMPFEMAGRGWNVEIALPESYLVANRSWQAWTVLAAGMLFTGLLGVLLLVLIGRTAATEEMITARTAELEKTNRALLEETRRRQEAEIEIREQATRLAASNKELEQFAYVASHDLQAPLRTVAGFAGLLDRRYRGKLGTDANEFLEAILAGVKEMQALIQDLLSLSRVNAERLQLDWAETSQLVARAVDALRGDVEAAHAVVETAELPRIQGDARLLTQLFQNLIANGIKFQPQRMAQSALAAGADGSGSGPAEGAPEAALPAPRISISAERSKNEWHFRVSDNGIGIAADQLDKLFLMFKRLHRQEEYPGTGIGLALCKKIVQLHGGRIWAESEVGKGTTIHFTLPSKVSAFQQVF